jgi:hypothetical protein
VTSYAVTYLPALGDTTRYLLNAHLVTQLLPLLQLANISPIQELKLLLDSLAAATSLLLLGPTLVDGE